MTKITLLAVASLLPLAFPAVAQEWPRFTVHHKIKFREGTEKDRAALKKIAAVRDLVEGDFKVAHDDLNNDGKKEIIILNPNDSHIYSGQGTTVIEIRPSGTAILLQEIVPEADLALTKEKVGKYRALASVDDKGVIGVGGEHDEPFVGKQMVFPMKP